MIFEKILLIALFQRTREEMSRLHREYGIGYNRDSNTLKVWVDGGNYGREDIH